MGDAADDDLRCGAAHLSGRGHAVTEAFNVEPAVRVEHDLDHGSVVERNAELVAESLLQLADQTRMREQLRHRVESLSSRLRKRVDRGEVACRAHALEAGFVCEKHADHSSRVSDRLWFADPRHRPSRAA